MAKSKKRNRAGRKPPAFGLLINRIAKNCQMTQEEFSQAAMARIDKDLPADHNGDIVIPKAELDAIGRMIMSPLDLPETSIVVESLNGHTIFNSVRCFDHIDHIALALQEFSDEFWEGKGCTIMDLRRDRKNRTWGDDLTIMNFVYVAIAMELAEWSYPRTDWRDLPAGMPFVTFKGPRRNEAQITNTEGLTNETNSQADQSN
jgi:hypothetical protein